MIRNCACWGRTAEHERQGRAREKHMDIVESSRRKIERRKEDPICNRKIKVKMIKRKPKEG